VETEPKFRYSPVTSTSSALCLRCAEGGLCLGGLGGVGRRGADSLASVFGTSPARLNVASLHTSFAAARPKYTR
jgi:hypothetical protein